MYEDASATRTVHSAHHAAHSTVQHTVKHTAYSRTVQGRLHLFSPYPLLSQEYSPAVPHPFVSRIPGDKTMAEAGTR